MNDKLRRILDATRDDLSAQAAIEELRTTADAAAWLIPLAHASHKAHPKTWPIEIKVWLMMIEAKMDELLAQRH